MVCCHLILNILIILFVILFLLIVFRIIAVLPNDEDGCKKKDQKHAKRASTKKPPVKNKSKPTCCKVCSSQSLVKPPPDLCSKGSGETSGMWIHIPASCMEGMHKSEEPEPTQSKCRSKSCNHSSQELDDVPNELKGSKFIVCENPNIRHLESLQTLTPEQIMAGYRGNSNDGDDCNKYICIQIPELPDPEADNNTNSGHNNNMEEDSLYGPDFREMGTSVMKKQPDIQTGPVNIARSSVFNSAKSSPQSFVMSNRNEEPHSGGAYEAKTKYVCFNLRTLNKQSNNIAPKRQSPPRVCPFTAQQNCRR